MFNFLLGLSTGAFNDLYDGESGNDVSITNAVEIELLLLSKGELFRAMKLVLQFCRGFKWLGDLGDSAMVK